MRKAINKMFVIRGIHDTFTKEIQAKVCGYKYGEIIWSSACRCSNQRRKEYKQIAKRSTRNFIKKSIAKEVKELDFVYKGN